MRTLGVGVMKSKFPLAVVMAALAATVMGFAASAQEAPQVGQVRAVDSSDPAATAVEVLYTGKGSIEDAEVRVNGDEAAVDEVGPVDGRIGNVIVVDTSAVLDEKNALVPIREALIASADDLSTQQVAVVAAGQQVELLQGFTDDPALLTSAFESLTAVQPNEERNPTGAGAVWSAVEFAGDLLEARPALQPNVTLIVGSNDPSSAYAEAQQSLASAQAAVFGISFTGAGYGGGPTEALSSRFGGFNQNTGEAEAIGGLLDSAVGALNSQSRLVFGSEIERGEVVDLEVKIGDAGMSATYVQGTSVQGKPALTLAKKDTGGGFAPLQNPIGLILAVAFVLMAGGLMAYGLISLVVPDDSLSNVLEVYSEGFDLDDEDDEGARSAIMQRAVALTEQVAESQGYLARAEAALERADMPLRAGEALFFYAAVVVIVTVLALLVSGNLVFGIVAGLLISLIPPSVVNFKAGRRRSKFLSQLPDTLQLLSSTLRAGYSLMQGVEAVSHEIDGPMGAELRRVVTEARLGRPLEESLEGTAGRMASEDFAWCVMAIKIQREVGGNLSELLMTVADTMTARERLRRDINSLTAEGRVSAFVLGILPVGLGIVMYMMNPGYVSKLFTDTLGNILLGLAIVSMGIGFFWMKKIIDIEI